MIDKNPEEIETKRRFDEEDRFSARFVAVFGWVQR